MAQNSTQRQIIDLIKRSTNILILPSAPVDGDCLGSALSLLQVLKKLDKNPTIICEDKVPALLEFLPNIKDLQSSNITTNDLILTLNCKDAQIDTIKTAVDGDYTKIIITPKQPGKFSKKDLKVDRGEADYDLIITVDTAELKQLGSFYEENIALFQEVPVVNIDHHVSNSHFGKINYVDIMSSATTELLTPLIEELATESQKDLIDEDVATLLLTGIITDTGSFQHANTTPKAFAVAAKLISYGARQQEIIQHIYKTKQLSQLKLWGRVLTKIQTDDDYRIVWSTVSQQDLKDTQSEMDQTGDIIDELMTNAPGAQVVLLFKEKTDGSVTASVRTTSPAVDGAAIAEHFGGGGHTQAAGFRLTGKELREAEYEVIDYVRGVQAERLGLIETSTEPMIDIEELKNRAEQAQKAKEEISKVEKKVPKKSPKKSPEPEIPAPKLEKEKEPKIETGVIYKFED